MNVKGDAEGPTTQKNSGGSLSKCSECSKAGKRKDQGRRRLDCNSWHRSNRTHSRIATRGTPTRRVSSVCSKPVSSISGRTKGPRCNDVKKKAEKRLKAAEECRDRTLAAEMQARHELQELQRRRGGPSPELWFEIQRVTVQMANTLSALRQLARFTDDGGVVVDPARVPCVSSQRHCGVSPARTRPSTTLHHRHQQGRPVHGICRLLHKQRNQEQTRGAQKSLERAEEEMHNKENDENLHESQQLKTRTSKSRFSTTLTTRASLMRLSPREELEKKTMCTIQDESRQVSRDPGRH